MREKLQIRLEVLKKEFETGQSRFRELEMQQSLLREMLIRISGAIQVLEELLNEEQVRKEKSEISENLEMQQVATG